MPSGSLTLTCLLLLTCQAAEDVVPLSSHGVRIGIRLDPARRTDVREMCLYVSPDRGRSWSREAVAAPTDEAFAFYAPRDGEYWFKAVAINKQGQQDPVDVYKGPVDQKVFIDSVPPVARIISTVRQGEDVVVNWEVQDNLSESIKLKLEYQPAPASEKGPWTAAPIPQQLRGSARVRVNLPGPVTFRLQASDGGLNTVRATAEVAGLVGGSGHQTFHQGSGALQTTSSNSPPPPVPVPSSAPAPVLPGSPTNQAVPPPPAPPSGGQLAPLVRESFNQPPRQGIIGEQMGALPGQPAPQEGQPRPFTPPPPPSASAPVAPPIRRKPLPQVQLVNNLVVVLDYTLDRVGPAGLGSVELWVTHNDGEKWHRMAEDDKLDASMKAGKYSRSVELPGEGVYGLALVVKNKAGRGKTPPRDGDAPEMRIEVDLTRPEGELYQSQPDPQRRDALLLTWSARDKNLAANPIALEWAQHPEGPWQTIQPGLPNTGRYSWGLPQGLPVYVYLRLRVRDAAGNEGFFVLNQPQLTDLSEPEGHLVNVTPVRPE